MTTIYSFKAGDLQKDNTQDKQPADPRPYKCTHPRCRNKSFRTSRYLRDHELTSHRIRAGHKGQPDSDNIYRFFYKIKGCTSRFIVRKGLRRHIKSVHGISNTDLSNNVEDGNAHEDAQDNQPNPDGYYTAEEGDARSNEPDNTNGNDSRPYKCDFPNCSSKGFKAVKYLDKHKRNIHNGQQAGQHAQRIRNDEGCTDDESQLNPRPFKCTVLGCASSKRGFQTAFQLKKHTENIHNARQASEDAQRVGNEEIPSLVQPLLPNPAQVS